MDNLGFRHEAEETVFSACGNSNSEGMLRWPGSMQLLSSSNGCDENIREASTQPKKTAQDRSSPKLSSSSFSLPKNRTLNKYRRFSESFSYTSRVPYCLGKMLNIPSREGVKHDDIKCSSFFVGHNNNNNNNNTVSKPVPGSTAKCLQHPCEDGAYKEINCSSSNPVRPDEYQANNKRLCSSQNFQEHTSVSSLLNNAQESSSYISVPSLPLNNNYHEEYLSSMSPFSITSLSPYFSNKQNLICDTTLDIHNVVVQPPKTTNKYSNLGPSQSFLNNAQCSGTSSPYLLKHTDHKFSKEDAQMNLLPCTMKSQKDVNQIMNRSTTLPAVTIKNIRNQNQEFTTGIPTVSGTLPMYYSRFLDLQQSSPNPCAENRQNMRQSPKVLASGCRDATLKKRAILRRWKLEFIPSDHAKRRAVALCFFLLLACIFALVAIGLIMYMTTAMKSVPTTFQESCVSAEAGVNVVAGEFRITNEKFEHSLKDVTSADFKQLTAQITQQLNILFSASTLSTHYNHSHVTQFSDSLKKTGNGGILVQCKLVLLSAPPNGEAANQAGLEFLRGLRHHQGQMWLGNFAIDVQSIGFVAVMDTTSLSHQTPEPPLLPSWSSWSAWSECNTSTAASPSTQMRSRLCYLGTGERAVLSSIEPCLLLEQAGGDLEVRDCENISTVTFLASRVLEEGEIVSNDISVEETVQSTAVPSSSSMETNVGNTATMQTIILKRTTEHLYIAGGNMTPVNSSRSSSDIPVMDLSLPSYRHCDECLSGEVCVALNSEDVPTCRQPHDPSDPTGCGGHCHINREFCHKLDVDAFRCLDDSYCLQTEWHCSNQLCIPQEKRCDGHFNCYDHTDEFDCTCNLTSHFQCGNNTSCLPLKKRCDGIMDCWDGSDELNCTIACPSSDQFTCNNGQCIPRVRFCDAFSDCEDKSDEPFGCGGKCKLHEWKCGNGRCIKKPAVCDDNDDCEDKTDEKNCPRNQRRQLASRVH